MLLRKILTSHVVLNFRQISFAPNEFLERSIYVTSYAFIILSRRRVQKKNYVDIYVLNWGMFYVSQYTAIKLNVLNDRLFTFYKKDTLENLKF